jgi:hypothetical protein
MRMRWAVHVTRMGERRTAHRILWESLKNRGKYEDLIVGGRIILKWILEKYDGVVWTKFMWLMIGTSDGKFLSSLSAFTRRIQLKGASSLLQPRSTLIMK